MRSGDVERGSADAFARAFFETVAREGVVQVVGLVDDLLEDLGATLDQVGVVYGDRYRKWRRSEPWVRTRVFSRSWTR